MKIYLALDGENVGTRLSELIKEGIHTWKDKHPTWFSFRFLGFFSFAHKAIFKYWK